MTTSPRDPTPAWVDRMGYPFESRFVALPAGRLHYVDEGSGEPILFVHGALGFLLGHDPIIREP